MRGIDLEPHPGWEGRAELVGLVTDGVLPPGRAIDLGCGEGDNAIFLAQRGFEVTAVDFARSAIEKARRKAEAAGVQIDFLVDDLTHPNKVQGQFDLLVDYGTLDDLGTAQREAYVREVVPLARPGARFLLWCFEWELRRHEQLLTWLLPIGKLALAPGEAERRFGEHFHVERLAGEVDQPTWPRGWSAYLLTRKPMASDSRIRREHRRRSLTA
jgi:SAM-dependent methyltransferase